MTDRDLVLRFIDDYYAASCQRPHMFSASPESFEDKVYVLELLRDRLLATGSDDAMPTYVAYCQAQGCGSALFLRRYRLDNPREHMTDRLLYDEYVRFLRGYLRSQGRSCESGAASNPAPQPWA